MSWKKENSPENDSYKDEVKNQDFKNGESGSYKSEELDNFTSE